MSVVFDIQGMQSVEHADRGIARYVGELAAALAALPSRQVDSYLLNPNLPVPAGAEALRGSGRLRPANGIAPVSASIFHSGSPFEGIPFDQVYPPWARRLRLVVTLYDLIPLLLPEVHFTDPYFRSRYLARLELVRSADLILAISESAGRDAIEHLGVRSERVRVVGTGVSEKFTRAPSRTSAHQSARDELSWLEPDFLLHVGGSDPRKNTERLVDAYGQLPPELRARHQLVIACSLNEPMRARIEAAAARAGVADRVQLTGFVPDSLLASLYQACSLFVFPSLYEGFGLPVAEAMACGAAAVVSESSSLVELVTDPAARCDPTDTASIRDAMLRFLEHPLKLEEQRDLARGRTFTWASVAERVERAYGDLVAQPRRRRQRRPHIAVVSPLPPQQTSVAKYTAHLLSELAEVCDVDAYVDIDPDSVELHGNLPVYRVAALGLMEAMIGGYDAVICCLGNSSFHISGLELLRRGRRPIVLAYEVRLTRLYAACCDLRPDIEPGPFDVLVEWMYGHKGAEAVWRKPLGAKTEEGTNLLMTREAIEKSQLFLVHSRHAAELARREAPDGTEDRIRVVPFAAPPVEPRSKAHAGSPLVLSAGHQGSWMRTETVLTAFALAARQSPAAQLAIVGPMYESERRRLLELAHELGVADRMTITGEVEEDEVQSLLERATVSVQLRAWSNGESPASVLESLAAGVPVVTSAVGALCELPDECAVKVPAGAGPEVVGTAIADLLEDEDRRRRLTESGLEYCAGTTFAEAARVLLELALERAPARAL